MTWDWAKQYEELYRILKLFDFRELSVPNKYSYTKIKPYIQDGPQCGLVALAMIEGTTTKEFIDILYQEAKLSGYTYNGELFCVKYMISLAKKFLLDYNVFEYSGDLNSAEVKEHLLHKGLILVPYDTDKNNYPGRYNGHKAHWAVVCGGIETENNFYVLARHGKAKNIAVWKLQDLSDSNAQLNEFCPDRKQSLLQYQIPSQGLQNSLRNKSVFIIKS